jgi:glyoxylase-like metal-dependent hydrolase (beta-lactamase superfamily II)
MLHAATVGDAQIVLIQDGELTLPTAELFQDVPPAAWAGRLPEAGDGQVTVPVHAILVRVDGEAILLDTGSGAAPGEGARGGALLPALAELGLTRDEITRVVISHTHGDHVGGLVDRAGDPVRPAFPRARHHLPRADWDWLQGFPDELRERYLRPLEALPGLTLDAPDDRLTPSVRSVGAAGHTPGHRCLVVESGGQAFCYLGDLVHYPPLHFAEPDRVTAWDARPELTPPSRRRVAAEAAAGNWLLTAAHASPALGRLAPDGPDRWAWRPVER